MQTQKSDRQLHKCEIDGEKGVVVIVEDVIRDVFTLKNSEGLRVPRVSSTKWL